MLSQCNLWVGLPTSNTEVTGERLDCWMTNKLGQESTILHLSISSYGNVLSHTNIVISSLDFALSLDKSDTPLFFPFTKENDYVGVARAGWC